MRNLINKEHIKIVAEIDAYLNEIDERAKERIISTKVNAIRSNKANSPFVRQHTVPNFLLKLIAAQNPSNVTKEKDLLLKKYIIEYNSAIAELSFEPVKELVSPKDYSVYSNIYNSSSFEDKFFMEILFSVVETDASRLIRSKVSEEYDLHQKDKEYNPFYFALPEYNPTYSPKPTKMRSRVILATFFAIQILRAKPRMQALADINLKYGMNSADFAGNIMNILLPTIIQTYLRQWSWIRVPNHEMFISELGMATVPSCFGSTASIMPISRRDFIYIHEDVESHFAWDDKLVHSTSSLLYTWYYKSLLRQIHDLEIEPNVNGNLSLSFVTNKEAIFGMSSLYNTRGCCFSCFLDPIRTDPRNTLISCFDILA